MKTIFLLLAALAMTCCKDKESEPAAAKAAKPTPLQMKMASRRAEKAAENSGDGKVLESFQGLSASLALGQYTEELGKWHKSRIEIQDLRKQARANGKAKDEGVRDGFDQVKLTTSQVEASLLELRAAVMATRESGGNVELIDRATRFHDGLKVFLDAAEAIEDLNDEIAAREASPTDATRMKNLIAEMRRGGEIMKSHK